MSMELSSQLKCFYSIELLSKIVQFFIITKLHPSSLTNSVNHYILTVITLYPTSNSAVVNSLLHSPGLFEAHLLFMMMQPTIMTTGAMNIVIPIPPDTPAKQAKP